MLQSIIIFQDALIGQRFDLIVNNINIEYQQDQNKLY